jgi:hypothetical protein
MSEAKKQSDDWRSRTCGECEWARFGMNNYTETKDQYGRCENAACLRMEVEQSSPVCPAFIAASIAAGKE